MKLSRRGWFGALFGLLTVALAGVGLAAAVQRPAPKTDDCCCIVRDGQLICTITGEVLDECCCR